jgi:hypothetical protein
MPSASAPVTPAPLLSVDDPGQVTGTTYAVATCHYRDGGNLPDPRCTPGSIDPVVTQQDIYSTICGHVGYTSTIRPPEWQTEHFKYDVAYEAYGLAQDEKSELDHYVPLELGGSNDTDNLWPEVGGYPNAKDAVAGVLNRAVCDGWVPLGAAQQAIAKNWMTAEQALGLTGQ